MATGTIKTNSFTESELTNGNTLISLPSNWKEAIVSVFVGGVYSEVAYTTAIYHSVNTTYRFGATSTSNNSISTASVEVSSSGMKLTSCYWAGVDRISDSKIQVAYR